eukprot:115353_1
MADVEERKKHLLSILSEYVYQNKHTDSSHSTTNSNNPCTQEPIHAQSYITHQTRNVYAQLHDKNELVWAYMNNEYHRCKIVEVIYPNTCDNEDDIDENDATPPLTSTNMHSNDTWSECSTPPIHTEYDSDCKTPPPPVSHIPNHTNDMNEGLCNSSMPIYRVLCLNPRYKEDIPCKHFVENTNCDFNEQNKCLYSHGWIEPQDRIKRMDQMDIHYTLKINDRCLAKWYKDSIWYKGRVAAINVTKHKILYSVQFDHYPDKTYNMDKQMVVPYTSALDEFHSIHKDESERIHCNTNTDFGDKYMIELSSSQFGNWQQHTTGIGLKYLMKFGYNVGDGLGRNKQGRSEPVPIKKIKRNVGLDFVNQNIENHNKNNTKKKKDKKSNERKRKLLNDRKRNKNVFETMNTLFNGGPKPKKKRKMNVDHKNELQRISELLFSLENERNLYQKKMKNTNDAHMRQHYCKLLKSHESRIKKLKMKHNYTETKRNQDSMYDMKNFKF